MVKVNGEMIDAAGKNIAALLDEMNCMSGRVAVELNEEIVPKSTYDEIILKDGDSVEVVRFVGGG
ncbi:MAG: sulfur carrier protein ThiS [Ruminococcus flavefaciens]|nr:sulfur carrier protein ThiS [Ruminococcus flavefaciens]MCM1360999.1 sulfur carrier protein ThiS [Clostridiales bacterium]MCM1435936.1 sulfur carrier protein ThiS [Ruminococcus flavefaciens]